MRLLERYIFRELITPYLFSISSSLFLLILGRMVQIAKYLFETSVTLKDIVELIIFATPRLAIFAFPLATVLAVTLTLNRLASSGETVAIEASGIPIRKLARPFFLFAAVNTFIALSITLTILPYASMLFREKIYHIGKSSVTTMFQEGMFIDSIPGFVFYFQKVSPNFNVQGVYLEDFREEKAHVTIVAERAYLASYDTEEGTFLLRLENGTIAQTSRGDIGYVLTFDRYDLSFSVTELLREFSRASSTKWEMNMRELWRASHEARTKKEQSRYGVEFHHRIILPFLSIILAMMMIPITAVYRARRFSSKSSSLLVAFLLFILFYLLTALGKGLAENEIINPAMAVYAPTGIFCLGLVYLWQKMKFRLPGRRI